MQTLSNFFETTDLLYIFTGILIFDIMVMFLAKYRPDLMGVNLNRWYDQFGFFAVMCDVLSIFLGFVVARWLYTTMRLKGAWAFVGLIVTVQIVHDLIFNFAVINPIPRGHNKMIDIFKDYARDGGAKILAGDSVMMIGSFLVAVMLKTYFPDHTIEILALAFYTLIYAMYTRYTL
jgi:hypothetical protein